MPEAIEQPPEVESGRPVAFRPKRLGDDDVEHAQRLPGLVDALKDLAHLGHLDAAQLEERALGVVEDAREAPASASRRSKSG